LAEVHVCRHGDFLGFAAQREFRAQSDFHGAQFHRALRHHLARIGSVLDDTARHASLVQAHLVLPEG
jgi:hypothetical protein